MKRLLLTLACAALVADCASTQTPRPSSAVAPLGDPPRDEAHPARNQQLLIPSHGQEMNALFFLAAGAGPHPTMLLLHGLPGNERNLDLAQAVRRAGWNVLTFTYRGAWGSPGDFSVAGAIADTSAAMDFLRTPEVVAKYGVDRGRLVIAGHSMGGLAAARHAANDTHLAGVILLDAWNAGSTGAKLAVNGPEWRKGFEETLDDLGHSLQGATPATIAQEMADNHAAWDLMALAPALAKHRVLTVYATHGGAEPNRALAKAIGNAGAGLTERELPTDHAFADHRIALAAIVVDWLRALPASP
jgi:pimeloyl-ACP methyl ester carboxylesterase